MNKRRVLISLSGALLIAAGVLSTDSSVRAAGPDAKGSSFDKDMDAFLAKDENVKKVGDALERYFQKKREEAQQQAVKSEQERMDSQFKNPVAVDLGDSPVRGNSSAKVTIVEFSDFQCPFCQRGAGVMDEVMKEYPKDVKVVFKNLPLPFHDKAKPAAKAAIAAGKQGKFWEMHDLLFKNQASLGEDFFVKAAGDLQLDVTKFKADMASPEVAKKIDDDTAQAQKLGVNGTPGFFVNGVLVSGAQPLASFKTIIDRWLKS